MTEALRLLHGRLQCRAYEFHALGRSEAAQTLWDIAVELDEVLNAFDDEERSAR